MVDLHPALVLLVGAVLVAIAPRRLGGPIAVASALVGLLAVVRLDDAALSTFDFYGYQLTVLRADGLSIPFATVFAVVAVLAGIYGWSTMGTLERAGALATAGAGIGVVLAGDLLTLFFFWELKVSTATMVIVGARRAGSSAAGLRYLGVHLLGGVVLLGGILWHLTDTGSLAFGSLELGGATGLILVGFLLCAAAVPLNAWLPDAYPEASVAGMVFLSAFTTKSAVYVLARGFAGLELLVWLGVAMALFGVVYAVLEDDIRRLLGYHIISQVGFMVAAVGVGTDLAVNGATAHAYAHVLYKGLLIMGVGVVLHATGRSRASELGGLARALPWALALYLVGALSISGVPLFSGFPAKELAVASVGDGGFTTAQWLLKLASVGTFLSVALKLPWATWFGAPRGPLEVRAVPVTMYLAMGIAAVANIAIGVDPGLLYGQMPTEVAFEPYTTTKLVEALQLFAFTGIGFTLLRSRLAPAAKTSVDTDWVYRELPVLVAARRAEQPARPTATTERRRLPRPTLPRPTLPRPTLPGPGLGPVAPGWLLGSVVAMAMVLVLGWSVVP
ncbi:MAG TPA: Na(+)/H(+) antiporter subunit D [Acidimicrobiales bacterium]|nr:Na(+)/H(+) antiporter subunit D [Acidimicrobiales bacterium]